MLIVVFYPFDWRDRFWRPKVPVSRLIPPTALEFASAAAPPPLFIGRRCHSRSVPVAAYAARAQLTRTAPHSAHGAPPRRHGRAGRPADRVHSLAPTHRGRAANVQCERWQCSSFIAAVYCVPRWAALSDWLQRAAVRRRPPALVAPPRPRRHFHGQVGTRRTRRPTRHMRFERLRHSSRSCRT